LLTLVIESVLRREPGHPQELILILTFTGLCAPLFVPSRKILAAVVLGACGGFLILTKINVGIFYCAAVFFPFVFLLQKRRLRTVLLIAGTVAGAVLPTALMRQHLIDSTMNTLLHWVLATGSILCLVYAASRVQWNEVFRFSDLVPLLTG